MKNIVKKILIGCVSLTIIIIMISAVIIIKNKSLKAEENIKIETSKIVQGQDIAKEKIPEIKNNEIIEETVQEVPITEEKTVESKKQTKQLEVNRAEQNKNTKVTTQNAKQNNKINENPSTTTLKAQTNNDNTNKPKENSNKPNVETNKNTSNTNNNTSTTSQTSSATSTAPSNQKVETFKYNKQMTEKMIKIITTNESEYMKQYGYNVVVDESIIANTNQFTFTEKRVKNSLKYKAGTIRVYARDYYVDEQYIWTECFIL